MYVEFLSFVALSRSLLFNTCYHLYLFAIATHACSVC